MIILFLFACQQKAEPNEDAKGFSLNQSHYISQQLAREVKEKVSEIKKVDEVQTVSFKDEVYISLKVTGFHRFFLKQIREDAHRLAKKVNEVKAVHVSTDKKIDMLLSQILEEMERGKLSEKELEKKLKKIEKDMKG